MTATLEPNRNITMMDSVDPEQIPTAAVAVAGYIDGAWPSYFGMRRDGSHRWIISIATSPRHAAMVLDVENGDATIDQAGPWLRRMMRRGFDRPALYCSLGLAAELVPHLTKTGLERSKYRLWTAHWTGRAHLCDSECHPALVIAAGATQYTSLKSPNVDVSLTTSHWLENLVQAHRHATHLG